MTNQHNGTESWLYLQILCYVGQGRMERNIYISYRDFDVKWRLVERMWLSLWCLDIQATAYRNTKQSVILHAEWIIK